MLTWTIYSREHKEIMVRIFQMWSIIDDRWAGEPVPISMWRARTDQLHMIIAFTLEQPLVATIYAIIFYYLRLYAIISKLILCHVLNFDNLFDSNNSKEQIGFSSFTLFHLGSQLLESLIRNESKTMIADDVCWEIKAKAVIFKIHQLRLISPSKRLSEWFK